MTAGRIEASELAAILAGRIHALASGLLPAGLPEPARNPRYWRVGSVGGEPGHSMVVYLTGPRAGRWQDFASGDHGDALDLVASVRCGGDLRRAIQWARAWLGLATSSTREIAAQRQAPRPEERDHARAADVAERRNLALRLYLAARPVTHGDPVSAYLAGRGVELAALPRTVNALRFHPDLWNVESGRHWPAMLAAINDCDGNHVATHRTWLARAPSGDFSKAPLASPKSTIGSYAGGAIRLWRGASGKPLQRAQPGERVIVAEGIEDGLSCALIAPTTRVLAAVSLSNMGSLRLPEAIGVVVIAAQNDPAGSPAERSLAHAIRHFREMGKAVRMLRPPVYVKDINELLQREAAEALAK